MIIKHLEIDGMPDKQLFRIVLIPITPNHGGLPCYTHNLPIYLCCPKCGKERGEPTRGKSYDGSQWVTAETWETDCEHVRYYSDYINEVVSIKKKYKRYFNLIRNYIVHKELFLFDTDETNFKRLWVNGCNKSIVVAEPKRYLNSLCVAENSALYSRETPIAKQICTEIKTLLQTSKKVKEITYDKYSNLLIFKF